MTLGGGMPVEYPRKRGDESMTKFRIVSRSQTSELPENGAPIEYFKQACGAGQNGSRHASQGAANNMHDGGRPGQRGDGNGDAGGICGRATTISRETD